MKGIEGEPKRDKSLAMRKALIAAEEDRVTRLREYMINLGTAANSLLAIGLPVPKEVSELPNLKAEYKIAHSNLNLMKRRIITAHSNLNTMKRCIKGEETVMELTYGKITTMTLTEINSSNELTYLLNSPEAYFAIKEHNSNIIHNYKISRGQNGTRWLCVQVWDGAYLFNAGIDSMAKLFKCKPKWCGHREYEASGIPSSANRDITFFKKYWPYIGDGVIPEDITIYSVKSHTNEMRLDND